MSVTAAESLRRDNLRGSILMVLSMGGFAIEDMLIKLLAGALPVGQILMLLGLGGAIIFAVIATAQGDRLLSRDLWHRGVVLRNGGEVVGTIGIVTALALIPLSSASAIMQAIPLAVTLGAALFLGEKVGWRRWSAIAVGFAGVLMVIRPGLDGFDPLSLFAVMGVFGLAVRDIATRIVPRTITSMQLSTYAFVALIPTGAAMMAVAQTPFIAPDLRGIGLLIGAQVIGVVSYIAIVAATRTGDVAAVAPFRYSRIVFALILAATVFDERPDLMTLLGAAIIVASGIYTLLREARRNREARRASHTADGRL